MTRAATVALVLLVAAVASPAAAYEEGWRRLFLDEPMQLEPLPAATHALVAEIRTEGARCVSAGVEMEEATDARYVAHLFAIATDGGDNNGLVTLDPYDHTPLETDRQFVMGWSTFKSGYDSLAHRERFALGPAVFIDESEGMAESRPDTRYAPLVGGGICPANVNPPSPLGHDYSRWWVYVGTMGELTALHVNAHENRDHTGNARVTSVKISTSDEWNVKPTYEWEAVFDRENADGTVTLRAEATVTVQNQFAGVLATKAARSLTHYTGPDGRVGTNFGNCLGTALCGIALSRADDVFIQGNDAGNWSFTIDALQRDTYPEAALMWMDIPDP